jgi:hypothetical protein
MGYGVNKIYSLVFFIINSVIMTVKKLMYNFFTYHIIVI